LVYLPAHADAILIVGNPGMNIFAEVLTISRF